MKRHLSARLGPVTTEEALLMLIGDRIGQGQFRDVYECPVFSGHVIKVSREHANVSNVMEWMLWSELHDTPWGKWLAPCACISPCGTVLLMAKCAPLERRPKKLPTFLADLKPENWGTHEGRTVCMDYGNNSVFTLLLKVAKMTKPDWTSNGGKRLKRTK